MIHKTLLAVAAAMLLLGCVPSDRLVAYSTVHIKAGTAMGSGVFITPYTILTAKHVVQDQETVTIHTHGGDTFEAAVALRIEGHDLAVLLVPAEHRSSQWATPDCHYNPSVGDEVQATGHPLNVVHWATTFGRVAASQEVNGKLALDITAYPGNSGGPVTHEGRLIGVTSSMLVGGPFRSLDGIMFAVPISTYCKVTGSGF